MGYKKYFFFSLSILFLARAVGQPERQTIYQPSNQGIVGVNTGRFNNRPLYINNSDAFVLAGDQPILRMARGPILYGSFMLSYERNGRKKALHHFKSDSSIYFSGKMVWILRDTAFAGLRIEIEVLTAAYSTGMSVSMQVRNSKLGDKLHWSWGGARILHETAMQFNNLSWTLDVLGHPEIAAWENDTVKIIYNSVDVEGAKGFIQLLDSVGKHLCMVTAECSAGGKPKTGNILTGSVDLKSDQKIYWMFQASEKPDLKIINGNETPEMFFRVASQKNILLNSRLKIKTPDRYFDAVAQATVAAIDGTWYPPVFHHGAMQWNMRFPGWRSIFGGTFYGWHDRVIAEAAFYISEQVKESGKILPKADSALLLTAQDTASRFFGVGYINKDQNFYNMQSQFFDQLIEEYRATNSPELIKILRPALELHLQWLQDCFDPDQDGVYESYLNTWPTDSQWYNGGGTAEETSYAYKAHLAAEDMARQAGDEKAAAYHAFKLKNIRRGFFKKLWIDSLGYSGSYREQGGLERLHSNPWLYSIFLPIDAGLLTREQAAASLYYTESALQNDRMPAGGRTVWTSNWVPGIWSVRENWPGDNYALAQAYFQTGLADDGWDLMRGSFMRYAFDHLTPGNLGGVQGGIDFGDCMHPFVRAMVQGMFGFHPDFPNNKVFLSPAFPSEWDNALLDLPDYHIDFSRTEDQILYHFKIQQTATLDILIPVGNETVNTVIVDGLTAEWKQEPGFGETMIRIKIANASKVSVLVKTRKSKTVYTALNLNAITASHLQIAMKADSILAVSDPQKVLKEICIEDLLVNATISNNPGLHSFFIKTKGQGGPQWRIVHIRVRDSLQEMQQQSKYSAKIPAAPHWKKVPITNGFNADIRTIYKQKYMSPRPNTVSARLGTDGYSAWTFPYWKIKPPVVETDSVKYMLRQPDELVTKQSVPFLWTGSVMNIAFTSLWDNYPVKKSFPVNEKGRVCYFLICGSTNVMQCEISNAVLRLHYVNGETDSLELVPPQNFWNLSPINGNGGGPGQESSNYYGSTKDRFCMPDKFPETVRLGRNCTAMLLNLKMRPGLELESVEMETLSQEVIVGLMGITIAK